MELDQIFSTTIKRSAVSVGQTGYGVPLCLAYHSYWPELVRPIGELSELTDAGVPTTDPVYDMVAAAKSAEPSPPIVMVGKRTATANQHTIVITPQTPVASEVYEFNVKVNGVVKTNIKYTADATPTVGEVTAGLQALFDAVAGITATDTGPGTSCDLTTDTAGHVIALENVSRNCTVKDTSADPGIAADLAAAQAYNPAWYFLAIDRQSEAEVLAAAAWAEANKKFFTPSNGDTEVKDSGVSNDVASDLVAASYVRTLFTYSDAPYAYPGLALCGKQGPKQPGASNWAWQQAPGGVITTELSTAEVTALEAKRANFFTTTNSAVSYHWGKMSGNEWADIIRGGDWLSSRFQERLQALFLAAEKVDYTAGGLEVLRAQILAQFRESDAAGFTDPAYPAVITMPTIEEISAADFAARTVPLVKAKKRIRGAINKGSFEFTLYQ